MTEFCIRCPHCEGEIVLEAKVPQVDRLCIQCGKGIAGKRSVAKFCSEACRNRHHRRYPFQLKWKDAGPDRNLEDDMTMTALEWSKCWVHGSHGRSLLELEHQRNPDRRYTQDEATRISFKNGSIITF